MSALADTPAGRLRGREGEGVLVFRGVPYAAPPTGALRFAPPEPAPAWSGERDAGAFGPVAPQRPDPLSVELGLAPDAPQGEDCLTLNVYTPSLSGRRPVMVWLHGGAFIGGTSATPLYDGARLAREGDVVVVTVSYRVGALGFLCLGAERANFGLLDQIEALRFVRRCAASFGGDPERVTVFGESAGAGSLCALLAMPAARGLFARAIVQSAAPAGVLRPAEAAERTAKLVAKLGIAAGDLDALRRVPLEALLDAQERTNAEGPYAKGMLFMPVVDGSMLPAPPLEAIGAGAARDVELVIGTTREEMHLYALTGLADRFSDALLPHVFAAQLAGEADDPRAEAERLLAGYRGLAVQRGSGSAPGDLFFAFETDHSLRMPGLALAERQAAHQPRTYVYLFTWPSPLRGGALRSCHALDLPFTFGTLDAPGMPAFAGSGPDAERVSAALRGAWTGFAHTGDPSHPAIGPWPAYTAPRRATMELGARCGVLEDPFAAERALWRFPAAQLFRSSTLPIE